SLDDRTLNVKFAGTGDMDAIAALSAFLKEVSGAAHRVDAQEVRFDVADLEFMNSTCFKSFVTFIDEAKTSGAPYKIRFLTDPNLHWQRRSLEALRRLALGLVTIETKTQ
ncbi:MAG TPA: hypothetical protein VF989_11435, partial [Polyangiaceae bacterium]